MGVPESSSSDAGSDHGQRIGTQSEGGGAAACNNGRRPRTAPQRSTRIHICISLDYLRVKCHGRLGMPDFAILPEQAPLGDVPTCSRRPPEKAWNSTPDLCDARDVLLGA